MLQKKHRCSLFHLLKSQSHLNLSNEIPDTCIVYWNFNSSSTMLIVINNRVRRLLSTIPCARGKLFRWIYKHLTDTLPVDSRSCLPKCVTVYLTHVMHMNYTWSATPMLPLSIHFGISGPLVPWEAWKIQHAGWRFDVLLESKCIILSRCSEIIEYQWITYQLSTPFQVFRLKC